MPPLDNGVLDVALAPSRLYGGEVQATVSVNASDEPPVHALHVDLTGVRALPLLTDLADFGSLDGRLQSKVDVRASGNSANAVVSSLAGTADVRIQDGQILGINVAKMIRTLTARTLLGWEDNRTESTDLTELSARFQIQDGRAQAANLRLLGPLVRVTGSGRSTSTPRRCNSSSIPSWSRASKGRAAPPIRSGSACRSISKAAGAIRTSIPTSRESCPIPTAPMPSSMRWARACSARVTRSPASAIATAPATPSTR